LATVSRQDRQWNIDETAWMSFIRQAGKNSFLNWMWVFASKPANRFQIVTGNHPPGEDAGKILFPKVHDFRLYPCSAGDFR
jgi:hypothetical protein